MGDRATVPLSQKKQYHSLPKHACRTFQNSIAGHWERQGMSYESIHNLILTCSRNFLPGSTMCWSLFEAAALALVLQFEDSRYGPTERSSLQESRLSTTYAERRLTCRLSRYDGCFLFKSVQAPGQDWQIAFLSIIRQSLYSSSQLATCMASPGSELESA